MLINQKKTHNIQFNFTKDKQFSTEIILEKEKLQTVSPKKLLGIIVTDQLKLNENTKYIVKKANQKMRMLHNFSKFTEKKSHILHIFKSQVRSVLEYCSTPQFGTAAWLTQIQRILILNEFKKQQWK